MPFIAPFVPAIAGAVGGLLGGGKPKRDDTEKDLLNRQLQLSDLGLSSLTGAKDYWANILKGGPDALMALSPEIRQINSGFDNQTKSVANFGPMGGGRSNLLAQVPYQKQAAISDVFSRARPSAAQGLSGIAGQASGLSQSLQQMMQNEQQRGMQGAARGNALGTGIFNIASQVPWGKVLGGGKVNDSTVGDLPFGRSPISPVIWN